MFKGGSAAGSIPAAGFIPLEGQIRKELERRPAQPWDAETKTASSNPPQASVAAPAAGMVWVNTETKVYHKQRDRWYGNTKHGQYMTDAEPIRNGYRAAKK